MKVSELEGAELDKWVAKANCDVIRPASSGWNESVHWETKSDITDGLWCAYCPSTDWSQGGPIIEREGIWLSDEAGEWVASMSPHIELEGQRKIYEGPTPLIAAMRCFVASKFGEEVTE